MRRGRAATRALLGVAVALSVSVAALLALSEQSVGAVATSSVTTMMRVAFASASHGVGLFDLFRYPASGTAGESCLFFTRATADGGSHFAPAGQSIAKTNCTTNAPVSQLASDGSGDVFAYGPGLFVSHDDGATWHASPGLGTIVAVAAVGRSVWALSESCAPASDPTATCKLTLLVSGNAGTSWKAARDQPPERTFARPVLWHPEQSSWLVRPGLERADVVLPPAAHRSTATVEQTADAGTTWSTSDAPCGAGWTVAFSIAPDSALWLACAGEPGAGEQAKSVARSLDGGKSWQRSGSVCQPGTTCHGGMPVGGYLGGLAALSSNTAFYVGGRSSLTVTRDAGRSWSVEPGFSGDSSGTAEVTFINLRDGWTIDEGFGGHAVLWRTTDSGARWTRLTAAA